ncbi:TetR/AcrR family transcriptional regulator [Cellulosimicrobium sp. Marseille-Q4280]|uniref:TetR/AcrR family transcriptional regulator n=1 Tax=Cellulosimicrobium sp. Marseille-Q4280 TaxID=2937992 RepID=UPI00203D378B|nr:TetR/AcrR family transcriptional regulator [Cellulosimicrobium sp. Marseille-Q4280]
MTQRAADGNDARRQRTRRALLDSATSLFEVKGYAATTVVEIARGAKVSERTFYVHFPSKEDVLFAHVQDFTTLAWRVAVETESPYPVERARAALLAMIDAASTDENVARHAEARAGLAARGQVPRALGGHLVELARGLSSRIAGATGAPLVTVAPMVGAAIGAVEAAGLLAAQDPTLADSRRDVMARALTAALHGFQVQDAPPTAARSAAQRRVAPARTET